MNKPPVIIALIGIVGSGKTTVAKTIAKELGTATVESNAIRLELREEGKAYDNVRGLVLDRVKELLTKNSSIVIDSDHIDESKRNMLVALAKKMKAKLYFVRVVCDIDTALQRIAKENYSRGTFALHGSPIVKTHDFIRSLPFHYEWRTTVQNGGTWKLKKLPFKITTTIDTTNVATWKETVNLLAKQVGR